MIETVVAIGIAVIIIGSLVTLINASNRRATLARQATQASKLAQEGMEIVRNIRDVNAEEAVQTGSNCSVASKCRFDKLYDVRQSTFLAYLYPPDPTAPSPVCDVGSWCLVGTLEPKLLDIFSRSVEISDDEIDTNGDLAADAICSEMGAGTPAGTGTYSNAKRVTVRVGWESPIGHQERTVTSCLTVWK